MASRSAISRLGLGLTLSPRNDLRKLNKDDCCRVLSFSSSYERLCWQGAAISASREMILFEEKKEPVPDNKFTREGVDSRN